MTPPQDGQLHLTYGGTGRSATRVEGATESPDGPVAKSDAGHCHRLVGCARRGDVLAHRDWSRSAGPLPSLGGSGEAQRWTVPVVRTTALDSYCCSAGAANNSVGPLLS